MSCSQIPKQSVGWIPDTATNKRWYSRIPPMRRFCFLWLMVGEVAACGRSSSGRPFGGGDRGGGEAAALGGSAGDSGGSAGSDGPAAGGSGGGVVGGSGGSPGDGSGGS